MNSVGSSNWNFTSESCVEFVRGRRNGGVMHVGMRLVQKRWSRVQSSGFRVQGSGFRAQGSRFKVQDLMCSRQIEGHVACSRAACSREYMPPPRQNGAGRVPHGGLRSIHQKATCPA